MFQSFTKGKSLSPQTELIVTVVNVVLQYSVVPDNGQQKHEDETVLLCKPKKTFIERRIAELFMFCLYR